MQLRRIDVKRVAAYGNRTVFVPMGGSAGSGSGEHLAEQAGNAMAVGFAAGIGAQESKRH